MDLNRLGRKIKDARESQEYSLEQFAGLANVAKNTIHTIENGEGNPTLGTIESIANQLGVPFADMLMAAADAPTPTSSVKVADMAVSELEKMIQENLGSLRIDERQLIKLFRKLSVDSRTAVVNLAESLGSGNNKKTASRRTGL